MDTIDQSGTTLVFFLEALARASEALRVKISAPVHRYLADVLVHFSPEQQKKIVTEPFLQELAQSCMDKNYERRYRQVKEIADASLVAAGFLAPYLTRGELGVVFYVDVGRRAYGKLEDIASLRNPDVPVFRIFARNLMPYVRVLGEIRAMPHFARVDLDAIVRRCRKYLTKKDDASRLWLEEHGIVLLPEVAEDLRKIVIASR